MLKVQILMYDLICFLYCSRSNDTVKPYVVTFSLSSSKNYLCFEECHHAQWLCDLAFPLDLACISLRIPPQDKRIPLHPVRLRE